MAENNGVEPSYSDIPSIETDEADDYLDPETDPDMEEQDKKETAAPTTPATVSLNIFTSPTTTTERPVTTTEYVEPEILNTPPVIKSRLPKQPLTAGKPFG